ncbi:hypothetical protein QR680_005536 [Steinernema hermaphroditum]|uniref:UDP-N-acetylglucosamine--dolichyl-phosphate N-acetylglucosaminephosphotransferase n=1 Tax=Steinernema hermaphroditum TaxID=289476 RepID=A0AA39HSD0_9BILA|nr:hypothetical protein QR680_005536 [Steinernema hermaphroditum]
MLEQTLLFGVLLSICSYMAASKLIQEYIPIFVGRKMCGRDMCKRTEDQKPVPEPMGVIAAAAYLITMFVLIPFPFWEWAQSGEFPYVKLLAFLSGLISICTAILLGFADDVLDLRWRHKLLFPTISSLPLLMVYYVSGNSTSILLPKILYSAFPYFGRTLNIGVLYYLYMGMVIVFCTNAINIVAGINGVEAGQSLVIAVSVACFNIIQLMRPEAQDWPHVLSLCFLSPFIASTLALLRYNWFPARVFVGDTFCYWAGMSIAVVGILGHFSKTLILFLIPQVFNFVYSVPQLFHLVPCPRHRLPKFNPEHNVVGMSFAEFRKTETERLGNLALKLFQAIGLLYREEFEKDGEQWVRINNLTILNLILKFIGPMREDKLTWCFLGLQVLCSCLALFIRFGLASLVYDVVEYFFSERRQKKSESILARTLISVISFRFRKGSTFV